MKRLLLLSIIFSFCEVAFSQDIPLFSQKLTNSFMYNPALAGHTFGSATTSYRNNYNNVQDAPKNFFLSIHAPFANHRFGAGANIYQEQVSFIKNTYYSAAFAYHLALNKFSSLSMGVSGELNQFSASATETYILMDKVYARYQNGNKPDFSAGLMYQSRYVKMGISANRLATAWLTSPDNKSLSNYYTTFINGMIPIRGGEDMLEPYMAYRKFSETNDTYDLGLFYTYNNKITAGGALRAGSVMNFTLAYRLSQYLLVGYSTEIINNPVGGFVGSSNEFTLRYDFNDQSYQKRFRADYKQSIAYRRKSMSGKKPNGAKNSRQLAKAQKRVAAFSPNSRYQNTKKLSMGKKSSGRKAPKPKKKKPGRKGKVNNFKAKKR